MKQLPFFLLLLIFSNATGQGVTERTNTVDTSQEFYVRNSPTNLIANSRYVIKMKDSTRATFDFFNFKFPRMAARTDGAFFRALGIDASGNLLASVPGSGSGISPSDTAAMLSNYIRRQELKDTATAIRAVIPSIAAKLNISDTASMLSPYLRKIDTTAMLSTYLLSTVAAATYQPIGSYATTAGLALKVNVADTAAMLVPYLRSNIAAATYATISNLALKVNISDTASMLSSYLRKIDTTAMLSPYLRSNIAAATYQPVGSYLTGNQSITFTPTGDVTGSSSGATSLTPNLVIGPGKVTNTMIATGVDAAKLNTGVVSNTELNYLDGVTSGIQGQVDGKQTTSLLDGKILIGNGSNVATAVTPSGDIGITNAGVTSIGALKVTNAMLFGGIAYSKLSLTGAVVNGDLAGSIDATKINTGVVSNAEFNFVDGVTSAIQTQINLLAPLASPTFTGTPAAPTAANGTSTTQVATTAFVTSQIPAGYVTKKRTADTTSASTTLANLGNLFFPVVSGTYYYFKFVIIYQAAATTTGIKLALTFPAVTVQGSSVMIYGFAADGATTEPWAGTINSSGDVVISTGVVVQNVNYIATIEGTILPSANGNLVVQWASEAAANCTLKQASIGYLWTL